MLFDMSDIDKGTFFDLQEKSRKFLLRKKRSEKLSESGKSHSGL